MVFDLGPLGLYGEIDDARPRARDSCTSYATENTDYLTELRFLSKFDWASGLYYPMLRRLWDCFFSHDFEKNGKDVFRKHYQEVRDLVPPENLLEYQVGMGWEPLCKFLGHHVPPTPFPRLSDTEDFVNRCRKRKRAQWMNIVFRMFCMASMVFAAGIFVLQLMHKYVFK